MMLKSIRCIVLFSIVVFSREAGSLPSLQSIEREAPPRQTVRGEVVDADTGRPLAARVYIQDDTGAWHHVTSAAVDGSAVRYEKRNWVNPKSEEFHTTVSAHPFETKLASGQYQLTVERGKEYLPTSQQVTVGSEPVAITIKLQRWVDMASRGWYSGDTHVHRTLEELPNVMLAEDLNVALPLTGWVTEAYDSPFSGRASLDARSSLDPRYCTAARNDERGAMPRR